MKGKYFSGSSGVSVSYIGNGEQEPELVALGRTAAAAMLCVEALNLLTRYRSGGLMNIPEWTLPDGWTMMGDPRLTREGNHWIMFCEYFKHGDGSVLILFISSVDNKVVDWQYKSKGHLHGRHI